MKIFHEQLARAEKRFGRRAHSHKIEVIGRASPTPETILLPNSHTVHVYYFEGAQDDGQRLILQLAHEATHVLAGAFRRDATLFEEGLAVDFSLDRVSEAYRSPAESSLPPLFRNAVDRFRELRARDTAIKKLRKEAAIDAITPPMLEKLFDASPDLAAALCERVSIHDADRV